MLKKEIIRKLFHIISILLLLFPLKLFGKYSITFLMIIMLLIFYPISKFRIKNIITLPFWKILELVEREKNLKTLPAKQAFALAIGLVITSLIFDEETLKIAIISTAVYDGFATIGGKIFGRIKLINNRTLEGSITGILSNTIALTFLTNFYTALLISIFVAFIEMISTSKDIIDDDNFLIPITISLFYFFIKGLGA